MARRSPLREKHPIGALVGFYLPFVTIPAALALGVEVPTFGHLPLIMGPDRKHGAEPSPLAPVENRDRLGPRHAPADVQLGGGRRASTTPSPTTSRTP